MSKQEAGELLEFATGLAWRAGRLTLAHFQAGVEVEAKGDDSPVTVADRGSEQLMRDAITARFPEDAILGEEYGEVNEGAKRRWIMDPIDGTRSFVQGVPLYGVLLALEEAGEVTLGVAHFPALGETLWATRGGGAWWNGRRARVSVTSTLADSVVMTTDPNYLQADGYGPAWERLKRAAGTTRYWGDCYGYALVATGRAEVMLDSGVSAWDVAALKVIVEEAGGVFTGLDGARTHLGGSGVATNALLVAEVRRLLDGE